MDALPEGTIKDKPASVAADAADVGSRSASAADGRTLSIADGAIVEHRMRKRYNLTSMFALYLVTSAGWEGLVGSLFQVVVAGGPTALIWGYIVSAVGGCCVAASVAEYSSIWPGAGAQYHWAMHLTPPRYRRYIGFVASYLMIFMMTIQCIAACYTGTLQIQAITILTYPEYVSERWHTYLIYVAIILLGVAVNIFAPRLLHHLSILACVCHVAGLLGIMITLLVTTEHKNSSTLVFDNLIDNTGWQNKGICFLIGMLPGAFGFMAINAPSHYAEETEKPYTDISNAMCWGTLTQALMNFPFVLTIAFCMGDPADIMADPVAPLSPLVLIVRNSTGSLAVAIFFCSILATVAVVASIFGVGMIARILLSGARDDSVPFGKWLSQIHPRWNVPMNAIITSVSIEIAIAAIYIGNTTAYYGISSGAVVVEVTTMLLPIALHMIFHRNSGLVYGDWKMPASIRWFVNALAFIIFGLLLVAMVIPSTRPITPENMNYASLLLGFALIASAVLWPFWGRKNYFGPKFIYSEEGHGGVKNLEEA